MLCSRIFGVELLVIILGVCQSLGFIITYILSVVEGHVTPELPYISDTGARPPESCVFSFVCSVTGIIALIIIYIRFQHIHQYYHSTLTRIKVLNYTVFVLGNISILGLLLVGAFQDDYVKIVHFIGAGLVFGFGILYMWLQTYISYKIYHASLTRHVGSIVIIIRLVLCILATLFFIVVIIAMQIAAQQRSLNESKFSVFYWDARNGGYALHLTSTISEWLLGISFLSYFLTFHNDFARISVLTTITLRYQTFGITESTPLTV